MKSLPTRGGTTTATVAPPAAVLPAVPAVVPAAVSAQPPLVTATAVAAVPPKSRSTTITALTGGHQFGISSISAQILCSLQ